MLYLLIVLFAAVAGVIRLWLLQRQEQKMELAEDFRYNLQRLATQPLAQSDLPEEHSGRIRTALRDRREAREQAVEERHDARLDAFVLDNDPRYAYLGHYRLWRKPREPWFVSYTTTAAPQPERGPRREVAWAVDAFWREPVAAGDVRVAGPAPARQPRHLPAFEAVRSQGRRAALDEHKRDAAKRRIELRRAGQVRA